MEKKKPLILAVDDQNTNLQYLGEILESLDYEIALAMNGRQALEFLVSEKPDLILLDIMMPEMDGIETCLHIKKNIAYKNIPVIFLTAKTEIEDISRAFSAGAVDYITKPFHPDELKARIKNHLELKQMHDELSAAFAKIEEQNRISTELNEILLKKSIELEAQATTDYLTGLFNRRYLMGKISDEHLRFKRTNQVFSLVISDIDHFKNFNDTWGHECGDVILKNLSDLMKKSCRGTDIIARWGGEEFMLFLPSTAAENAVIITEKLRIKINTASWEWNNMLLSVTMTFGITEIRSSDSIDSIISRADDALYEGKNQCRNVVIVK